MVWIHREEMSGMIEEANRDAERLVDEIKAERVIASSR